MTLIRGGLIGCGEEGAYKPLYFELVGSPRSRMMEELFGTLEGSISFAHKGYGMGVRGVIRHGVDLYWWGGAAVGAVDIP